MLFKTWKRTLFIAVMALVILATACVTATPAPTQESEPARPTVWMTKLVTQIVATAVPTTPPPVPTETPYPTATLSWDPLAVPIYYPVVGCVASRLHQGDMAFVGWVDRPLRIYDSREILADPGRRELQPGEILYIVDGPWCEEDMLVWWAYAVADEIEGFVPEGDGTTYWLLPLEPTFPTPDL